MDPSNTTNMPPIAQTTSNTPSDAAAQRLARKAASARQARARHKNAVSDMEDEVRGLSQRLAALEEQRLAAANAASAQLREELRAALPPERFQTLCGWLAAAAAAEQQKKVEEAPELLLCALKSGAESALSSLRGPNGSDAGAPSRLGPIRNGAASSSSMPPPPPRTGTTLRAGWAENGGGKSTALPTTTPSGISPNTVMEGDDLLGCAMGILGLASTPAGVCGPTPTPAVMQPPPMTQLPPVQVPEAAAMPGQQHAPLQPSPTSAHAPLLALAQGH